MCTLLHQPVQLSENAVLMEDVFFQEKDVMESTTVETTLMKPTAVCLCLNTLVIHPGAGVKRDCDNSDLF